MIIAILSKTYLPSFFYTFQSFKDGKYQEAGSVIALNDDKGYIGDNCIDTHDEISRPGIPWQAERIEKEWQQMRQLCPAGFQNKTS